MSKSKEGFNPSEDMVQPKTGVSEGTLGQDTIDTETTATDRRLTDDIITQLNDMLNREPGLHQVRLLRKK